MTAEKFARLSLIFIWLFTAVTSLWWDRSSGHALLSNLNLSWQLENALINLGGINDLMIGLWMLSGKFRLWNYKIQIALILSYCVLISAIAPQLWLHPFGPVTKNIPIIALILILLKSEQEKLS